ncbi:hypothetical protein [Streptomyces sp. NPDC050856]|uniref:SCO2583 family membrane protein n=1 Tax=Streptomyces sp. NPDC050856 TaxID=3154939 RepID=UPI0033F720C4
MAGSGDPPEGTPDGLPGGGDDEYRSVVFDESFVRAARLQEYSAQERLGEHARAVRSVPRGAGRSRHGALALLLVIATAFAAAIYLGVRQPHLPAPDQRAETPRTTVIPLAPLGAVPGGEPDRLYARSPAAQFAVGAAGVTLPSARRTAHFAESQVVSALSTAKDYLVQSSLDPGVLTGGTVRPVRMLLDPDQQEQFDRSVESPADDGRHAATGWLVRFDAGGVELADPAVRVRGTMRVTEPTPDVLEVTTDHTFVYALRPAGSGEKSADASLFTVRRELRFRFDREDLRMHRAELVSGQLRAGPQDCSADAAGALRPLLAGRRATGTGPAVTDPYAIGRPTGSVCGVLAPAAQPSP